MAGEWGSPYRAPCGGWPAKRVLHLGGCRQHWRAAEDGIQVYENLTKVSGVAPTNGNAGPADACGTGEISAGGNCYKLKAGVVLDLADCEKHGWKAVKGRKVWHGRPGLTSWKAGCGGCQATGTKYRRIERTVTYTGSGVYYSPSGWSVDGSGEPIESSITYDDFPFSLSISYKRTYEVDPDSGVISEVGDCVTDYTLTGDAGPTLGAMPQAFYLSEEQAKRLFGIQSDPCASPAIMATSDDALNPKMGWFPQGESAATVQDDLSYSNYDDSGYYVIEDGQTCVATLTDSLLQVTATDGYARINCDSNGDILVPYYWDVATSGWVVMWYSLASWEWEVKVTLSAASNGNDLIDQVGEMMDLWDLTDDVVYPWRTDTSCTMAPQVQRDEKASPADPDLHQSTSDLVACDYVDPDGDYSGDVIGGPLPEGYGPYYSFDLQEWNPGGGLPDTATHWVDGGGPQADCGWIHYGGGVLLAQKHARIKGEHHSLNYGRACGADRDAIEQDDAANLAANGKTFCENQTANTPVYRFPDATPICGRVAVVDATNASPIVVEAAEDLPGLRTGDQVVVSGVVGNTAANGTFTVTVVDTTHFSLDSSTGNGDYESGGWVQSPGVDYEWNDDNRKGDFVFKTFLRRPCDGAGAQDVVECETQCLPLKPCCPSVVCVSPNAEAWCNGVTEPFPADGDLFLDEDPGCYWVGAFYLVVADPFFQAPHDTCDDPPEEVSYTVPMVEARCAAVVGAPALHENATPTWGGDLAEPNMGGCQPAPLDDCCGTVPPP